jgi:hypothetical protein
VKRKNIVLFVALGLHFASMRAEDSIPVSRNNSPFSISLELTTKYMWRAIEYGDAPTTFAIINYENKGFSAYAEGVYEFDGSHQEVDLGVAYNHDWLTAGVNDYYYPSSVGEKDKYFKLSSRQTGHYLEGVVTIAPEKIPLWLTLSTYFWGADKKPSNNKNAYSSYAELGYRHSFNDNSEASLALGAALNKGFYTDYEHGFNVVNITAKYATSFKLGKFRLPVSASYVLNPYRNKSYVTLSIYFNSKL